MKNRIIIFFALLVMAFSAQAQDEQYWLVSTTEPCEGYAEVCVEPFTQEIGLYEWYFEGQLYQTDTLSNCIYFSDLTPGAYQVGVILYDWNGNIILHSTAAGEISEILETTIFIEEAPFVEIYSNAASFCPAGNGNFGCEKVCENTTITYTAESFGQELSYVWNVTGALSWESIGFNQIEVNWGEAGSGQVFVYLDDPSGCSSTNFICVEILDSPEASFETMPAAINNELTICQGQEVFFENTTSGAIYYEWTFGDNGSSTDANPEHTFTSAGNYEVQLIAKNECYCSDTTTLNVIVEPTMQIVMIFSGRFLLMEPL